MDEILNFNGGYLRAAFGAGNFYMGLCSLDDAPSSGGALHRRIDVRCFEEREEAAALLHCTGSGIFNRQVQRVALALNLQLSEKGLCRASKQHQDNVMKTSEYLPMRTEEDIFDALGLVYVEPKDRNGRADVISKQTGRCWFEKKRGGGPAKGGGGALLGGGGGQHGAIEGFNVRALPAPRPTLPELRND